MRSIMIVLCLVVILGSLLYITWEDTYTDPTGVPEAIARLTALDIDAVEEIHLAAGETTVTLVRSGEGWILPDSRAAPAKQDKVQEFLAGVVDLKNSGERARSASSHERFEVAGEKARHVELTGTGAGLPARFVVGKRTAGGLAGHFLLLPGSETVYAVRGDLLRLGNMHSAELRARDWIDLTVFKAASEKTLQSITMERDGERIVAVRKPVAEGEEPPDVDHEGWEITEPEHFDANPDTMQSLLSAARQLQADDVDDPDKQVEFGLQPPTRRVQLEFGDETIALNFGSEQMSTPEADDAASAGPTAAPEPSGTGRFYLQVDGSARVFLVSSWRRDRLFKSLDELRPVPAEEPETAVPAVGSEEGTGAARVPGDNAGPATPETRPDEGR